MRSLRAASQRILSPIRTASLRGRGINIDRSARIIGRPIISRHSGSSIDIGRDTVLISDPDLATLGTNHPVILRTLERHARITISDHVGITGATICSAIGVSIGTGTLLGANATIFDTDFHPVTSANRRYEPRPKGKPSDRVEIGRNVFIGTGAIILKGTVIGDNSVVGAGAVVRGTFPSDAIIAGNPAIVVRSLDFDDESQSPEKTPVGP